jgi:hypothetical protein
MGDEVDADHAAGAGAGLDIELLAECLGQLVGCHAGQNVGGTARRKGVDDADRMARPILGRGRPCTQEEWSSKRSASQRNVSPHSAATRCAATPLAFTTTLIASSTRSLA